MKHRGVIWRIRRRLGLWLLLGLAHDGDWSRRFVVQYNLAITEATDEEMAAAARALTPSIIREIKRQGHG